MALTRSQREIIINEVKKNCILKSLMKVKNYIMN